MFSLVISTIGCPFLLDSLATLKYPPDDVIVVVDVIGRQSTNLDREYPVERLTAEVAERFPWAAPVILRHTVTKPWSVMNGCYNTGIELAMYPFVLFTHDDIEWPDFDFPRAIDPVLRNIEETDTIHGKRCVGLVLQEYEVLNGVNWPPYPVGTWGLTQHVSPVSQIVSKAALEEMGGFDETDGIWYDGHLEAETHLRDWWYLALPTPLLRHTSNRTYRANNWGDAWKANPIWGRYQENYRRRYGHEPERRASEVIPVEDHRFRLRQDACL